MDPVGLRYTGSQTSILFTGPQKSHYAISEMQSLGIIIDQKESLVILMKKLNKLRKKIGTADFPQRFVNSVVKKFIEPDHALYSDDLPLIPSFFFESPIFVLIDVPFCPKNERLS